MSLVGNFTTNYDRSAQNAGASGRRSSFSGVPRRGSSNTAYFTPFGGKDDDFEQSEDYFQPVEEREAEVVQLARSMTRHSQSQQQGSPLERRVTTGTSGEVPTPWDYEEGSDLDPFSGNFDLKKWTKAMLRQHNPNSEVSLAGVSYRNMSVHGFGSDADYQKTVTNIILSMFGTIRDLISSRKKKVQILESVDGVLDSGEMLVVLGPPGSGCTTLLKSIAGEMNGIYLDDAAELNYRGISPKAMHSQFRGEAIYTAEVDVHFPKLIVGDTLQFAAEARAPRNPPGGISRIQFARHMRDVMMSIFGISHTINTKVGNDFIRGVSGGERKRVTIAEATLASAPLQCWDNSTRGLDSANAIEFVKNLRLGAEHFGTTSCVAIYQAPQAAYDLFDKVSVLYEGEQIYFGRCTEAKAFFERMGFHCPTQQTTPDFLTSLTSPSERQAKQGWEHKVPQTPRQFRELWKASPEYAALQEDITAFNKKYPIGGQAYDTFLSARRQQQAKNTRPGSPYTLSYLGQIKLCLWRGFLRLKADPSLTLTQLFGNMIMSLIISSIFYNLPANTSSFYSRGGLLFFAILMSAFGSALEILTLYAQRPIVEKHAQYAFYHPSAESFASMLADIPYKVCNAIIFNLILYFMTNLRREPGPFFYFLFISFLLTLTMSMLFRSIASLSRTLTQALAPAAVIILGLVIYTGFAIPISYMPGWSRWMNYIDPIAYGFESMMINEFHGREYACSEFVPHGGNYPTTGDGVVCSAVGSQPGVPTVNGDRYIEMSFQYSHAHKWRNVGIIFAFMIFLLGVYITASELITAKRSKGEILIYPRGQIPKELTKPPKDEETAEEVKAQLNDQPTPADNIIQRQTAIFSWKDVVYDIKIKSETRRILDHVDGWVKPGTLTALMGVSGAGKTTLLDVLATRVTMGVVTGEMLVDGRPRDKSFQRKTGYVQQQDLHLQTSTVREALRFSAVLRQPKSVSRADKYKYVEEVLKLLEMEAYANAVVGVPGEGLNVEQRKRLTIGVELVAKPELLLFLDEPTSGLDSQTSWNILQLLRKLTANGQAILCTIHQPSAMLFENFDRLLFLAKGGRTVYYGEVGQESRILIDYFERNGAPKYPKGDNPAEWMFVAIGGAPGSHTDIDWHQAWLDSPERAAVREELRTIKRERRAAVPAPSKNDSAASKSGYSEFAAPFTVQLYEVLKRVFQQYWRTPSYIWAKIALCSLSGLFIGFSFINAGTSQQGLQNQLFSVFMAFTIFGQLVQQIAPNFVIQRSLYEVRERPSKSYSWTIFMLSNIIVEIPWSLFVGALFYFEWYYPIGMWRNASLAGNTNGRGVLMWLFIETFLLFTCTFATAITAGIELAETAGNIANLIFSLLLVFCGVLVPRQKLPGFWVFMNRVSPFTYLIEGILGTGTGGVPIVCSDTELLTFQPVGGTCQEYMSEYINRTGGYLVNPDATADCSYCTMSKTDDFLATFNIFYSNGWRDFGFMWAYIIFNICAALAIYWLARVPKNRKKDKDDTSEDMNRTVTDASGMTRQITGASSPVAEKKTLFNEKETYQNGDSSLAPAGAGGAAGGLYAPSANGTDGTATPYANYVTPPETTSHTPIPFNESGNPNAASRSAPLNGHQQASSDHSAYNNTVSGSTRVPSPEEPTR